METKRLLIREHRITDLASHHRLFSDKEVMYYLPDIQSVSLEQSRENLLLAIREIKNPQRKYYFFRIEEKISRRHVGEIGYTVEKCINQEKIVALGYFIGKEFWNLGYTSEALKELVRFAFQEEQVSLIQTGCLSENQASEKVMIKCGFQQQRLLPHKQIHDGEWKDRVEYALSKETWEQSLS